MIDGIYTAFFTGTAGQAMAMFVFKDGKIGGADMVGVIFSGEYTVEAEQISGKVIFRMPAQSTSITGAVFETESEDIEVPITLPVYLNPSETYQFNTPIGTLNTKFQKNVEL